MSEQDPIEPAPHQTVPGDTVRIKPEKVQTLRQVFPWIANDTVFTVVGEVKGAYEKRTLRVKAAGKDEILVYAGTLKRTWENTHDREQALHKWKQGRSAEEIEANRA